MEKGTVLTLASCVQPIRSSSPGGKRSPSSAFRSSSSLRKKTHPGEKELPPWKSSDKHPTDIIHFNYLDNCDPIEHTQLARVRTVPFSTSFLLETTYWHFGLRKDENRSYCEIQMLFTGGGGLVTESVRLCATPWTIAHQAPLSMGTLQARILEWVAILFSRDLPNPSIKTASAALQVDSLLLSHQGSPRKQKVIESK